MMDGPVIFVVAVEASGLIFQTGLVTSLEGAAMVRAPDGGVVLGFEADPAVTSQTHRYDFSSKSFVSIA